MRSSPKFSPITWANWLETGGEREEECHWKFFKEGNIRDIYTGNELNEMPSSESPKLFYCHTRSYRSLRRNEEPHYLFFDFVLKTTELLSPMPTALECLDTDNTF